MPSPSLFTKLDARLRALPDPLLLAIGITVLAGLAALKLSEGRDVPLMDFFLFPVAAVGWLARSWWYRYAITLIGAAVTLDVALLATADARVGAVAASGAARLILYLTVVSVLGAMRRMHAQRDAEACTDELTGVANLRALRALAEGEIERSRRSGHEISLLYLDIDDFKSINDQRGHAEGDRALRNVGRVLRRAVRSVDTVARLGGDEFAVLMPETDSNDASVLADRLHRELAGMGASDGLSLSCSIGQVTYVVPPSSPGELLRAGDELMYLAKTHGKDRVQRDVRGFTPQEAQPA
ncbi:MAG: GGDEF domain-containing protein [Thermoleophilia bacterium]